MTWVSSSSSRASRSQWNELLQAVAENRPEPLKQFLAQNERAGEVLEKVRDKDGRSLLHVAAFEGSSDALSVLLRCPRLIRKLNSADHGRRTPLHLATAIGDEDCVRSLANAKAVLDPQDEWSCTPLHLAIKFDQLETARLLLQLGANAELEDVKGDSGIDMAKFSQDPELYALMMSVEPRKKKSAWKRLLPFWGWHRRRSSDEERQDSSQGRGKPGFYTGKPGSQTSPQGRLPVAQRLAGNTEHQCSPPRSPKKELVQDGGTAAKGTGKGVQGSSGYEVPSCAGHAVLSSGYPLPSQGGDDLHDQAVGPLAAAISEAARARSAASASLAPETLAADLVRSPLPPPPPLAPAAADPTLLGAATSAALASKTARPAELYETAPRSDGLEAALKANAPHSFPSASARDPAVQDHGSAVRASSDTEDDISSSGDEGDYESPEDDYDQPEDEGGAVFRFHFLFDNSVSRLGFEVAWQRRGEDDMEPSVGNVQNGGEAARRGIEAGDEIIMCNDTTTEGKVRSELIPLLKQRPLLLKVDRRLILTDPRASCVTVLTKIEIADDLGLKLLQAGEFPGLAAVRPGSAAEAAGLLAGDVIISIGAQRLEKLAMPEVKAALQKRPLSLTLWRFPLSAPRWPQGFERWDSQGFGRTIVDLQTQ